MLLFVAATIGQVLPQEPAEPYIDLVNPAPARPVQTMDRRQMLQRNSLRDTEAVRYIKILSRHRIKIAAFTVAVTILSYVGARLVTPMYRATSTLLIEASKPKVVSIESVTTLTNVGQEIGHFQTQLELLKSREIADSTIKALRLWEKPGFQGKIDEVDALPGSIDGANSPEVRQGLPAQGESLYRIFARNLRVEAVGLSQLIKVSFDATTPELSAEVANEVSSQYIKADRAARLDASLQASKYLDDKIGSLREKLSISERALQQYRDKKGIISLSGSAQTAVGQQLTTLIDKLTEARNRRTELESDYLQLTTLGTDNSDVTAVIRDPSVQEALKQVNEAKRRLAELSNTYGSQNYRIKQAESEIAQLDKALKQQRASVVASMRREYESARKTEQSLEKTLALARQGVQEVNKDEFQLAALEGEVATNRQLYELFVNRYKETSLGSDVQISVARIADRATPPTLPIRPAKAQIVLLSFLIALLLSSASAIGLEHFNDKMKDAEDTERKLGIAVLTTVPQAPTTSRGIYTQYMHSSQTMLAESIRTAKTGILLSSLDLPHKILLVTSALAGEGKTTFACNLALAHAETQRTLLIDADMRRPKVSQGFDLSPTLLGLTNLLAGNTAPKDAIHAIPGSNLLVMPVGDVLPKNPSDFLLSKRFQNTLKVLSERFDVIVIDSPPVELVSDALVIARSSTATLLVIKALSTPSALVDRTLTRLRQHGALSIQAVLNGLAPSPGGYGYYGMQHYAYVEGSPQQRFKISSRPISGPRDDRDTQFDESSWNKEG